MWYGPTYRGLSFLLLSVEGMLLPTIEGEEEPNRRPGRTLVYGASRRRAFEPPVLVQGDSGCRRGKLHVLPGACVLGGTRIGGPAW
jgi:hypothetical protein